MGTSRGWAWIGLALLLAATVIWLWRDREEPPRRHVEWRGGPVYERFSSQAGLRKNKERFYDFYAKQAIRYLDPEAVVPDVIADFVGLDGGRYGHWGAQSQKNWRSSRWNLMESGSAVAGAFENNGAGAIPKALCLRLGEEGELSVCVDLAARLTPKALWENGFVAFDVLRFGLLGGLRAAGSPVALPAVAPLEGASFLYHGYYRHGKRVVFSYRLDGVERLLAPWAEGKEMTWATAEAGQSPLAELTRGGPAQWAEPLITHGHLGKQRPYALDTIDLPFQNPWRALLFLGDHDFFSNGDIAVCSIMGDVWRVTPLDPDFRQFSWKRFATGLHQPLGLKVLEDKVHVLGRDQITRLHDLNHDGEADFYQCVTNAYVTSPAGHDFITGLQTDAEGRFYFASANQGVCRIKPGEAQAEVLATGLRNPNGLGLGPQGEILVSSQEGEWTPASMICEVQRGGHYGLGGPKPGPLGLLPPLCYLPRGLDHSSGAPVFAASHRWGPLGDSGFIFLTATAPTCCCCGKKSARWCKDWSCPCRESSNLGRSAAGFIPWMASFTSRALKAGKPMRRKRAASNACAIRATKPLCP